MSAIRVAILAHPNPRGGVVPNATIQAIQRETCLRLARRAAGPLAALIWDSSAAVRPVDRQRAEPLHA